MPTLWRMSNYPDLSGTGGLYAAGPWHLEGRRVVYLADSTSTALLETLVHLEVNEGTYPDPRKLLEILVPEDCDILELKLPERSNWIADLRITQKLGTEWLRSMASPLAVVPSALVAEARNYLLNPKHPDADIVRIVSERWQSFDTRLFQRDRH